MSVFVFPGQGSQMRGMGAGLFDEVREYQAIERQVDEQLGYCMRRQCLDDTGARLKETQVTQPALYVVNALHYYKAAAQGERPTFVAGHSLGEYSALLAAGVFDFLTGLRIVQKRGAMMAEARNGAMAAVIGLSNETIRRVLLDNGLSEIDVANFNSPSQIVISGPAASIQRVGPLFEKAGASMYMPLPVSAAFHSRYMENAAAAFGTFLQPFTFRTPTVPVIANVTGQPYPAQCSSNDIKDLLVRQIRQPVQWTQSIQYLLQHGETTFKEIGPGSVLTRLIGQIRLAR